MSEEIPNDKTILNPDIPDKALKILRGVAKGNGIDPKSITYETFDGEIVRGRAQITISLSPLITKKLLAGKDQNGIVVGSEQELQAEIVKSTEVISSDGAVAQKIKDMFLKKEGQGFALTNYKQKFHGLQKALVLHKPCNTCHAHGKIGCTHCKALGEMPCNMCRGTGRLAQQNSNVEVHCRGCQGRGKMVCLTCKGHRKTQCHICAASGWMTDSVLIEQEGIVMFHVNRDTVSNDFAKMVEDQGIKMALKHDLEADVVELTDEEKTALNPSQTAIGYTFRFPYGPCTFKVKEEELTSILLGYQGRLIDCPAFLEKAAGKHLKALKHAAISPSTKTYGILEKACKMRLIRDVIQASAEQTPKNAMKLLRGKYPYGVQDQTLKTMVNASKKSFLDLTKAGRIKGVVAGLVGAMAITGLYYFVARDTILASVTPTTNIVTALDVTVFLVGFGCNISIVQFIGKMELSKKLQELLKKPIKVRATQIKTGYSWIWSLIGNLILFFGVSLLAFMQGAITMLPIWL